MKQIYYYACAPDDALHVMWHGIQCNDDGIILADTENNAINNYGYRMFHDDKARKKHKAEVAIIPVSLDTEKVKVETKKAKIAFVVDVLLQYKTFDREYEYTDFIYQEPITPNEMVLAPNLPQRLTDVHKYKMDWKLEMNFTAK